MQQFGPILVNMAADVCHRAKVPISLHLDHCQDVELVKYAASLPFDSIMVDMSHYEKEENLALTRKLTQYCHERGIATEAEPGRIEGGEDGISDTADLTGLLTSPEEAEEFVDTGIDWLAPAFGNVHGNYGTRGIVLEYDRLEAINDKVGDRARLVLHGTDGFDKAVFKQCIDYGISKVNINKAVNKAYADMQKQGKYGITQLMEKGTDEMQGLIEKCMDDLGSTGKAKYRGWPLHVLIFSSYVYFPEWFLAKN